MALNPSLVVVSSAFVFVFFLVFTVLVVGLVMSLDYIYCEVLCNFFFVCL